MFRRNPRTALHRHGPGLTGNISKVPHRRVVLIHEMIMKSKIPAQLALWREADHEAVGRPKAITDAQVLIVMLILAFEGSALAFLRGAEMLTERFHAKSLELLEIEPIKTGTRNQRIRTWNNRLQRGYHDIVAITDPYPGMRWMLLTNAEWDKIEGEMDQERKLEMWRRLDWLCNEIISLCINTDPSLLEHWNGNLTIDATAFGVFSKAGHNKTSIFRSSYARASWYLRNANHQLPKRSSEIRKAIFGFELHLVAAASNDGRARDDAHAHLVLAMTIGRPSRMVSHLGLKAITFAHQRFQREDRPSPLVVGDRGYFANAKPENLQLPVRALGYRIMTDYRDKQLGDRLGYAGAMQVEGAFYCPGMPAHLRDATINSRKKAITKDVWHNYIAARKPYLLRRKELPAADGSVKLMCPALGPNATVTCPIRDAQPGFTSPAIFKDRHGKERIPIPIVPSNAPTPLEQGLICRNKSSVRFPLEAGAKYLQALLFGTEEWSRLYKSARNLIESVNAYIKDEGHEALGVPGLRRARGATEQYILVSLLILASNMRRANTFIYGHPIHGYTRGATKVRRRDFYNGYKFDPATGEGLAPEDGLGGFNTTTHFVGDIEQAAIEYELDDAENDAAPNPEEIDDFDLDTSELDPDEDE